MTLGRGLEALIPSSQGKVSSQSISKIKEEIEEKGERVVKVPLEKIKSNPAQPRQDFSYTDLEELIDSIRIYGIIQPLIFSPLDQGYYQIIAGERRFRAAKFLELETVPGIIRQASEQEKLEIALLENVQRQDLNPIERAEAYLRLSEEFNLSQEEVAKRLGKSRSSVANTLRLLSLPQEVQQAIREKKISEGHGKILAGLKDQEKQVQYLKRILGLDLSVRETKKIVKGRKRERTTLDPITSSSIQEISQALGVKVYLQKQNKGGKLIFKFQDNKTLDYILEKLKSLL